MSAPPIWLNAWTAEQLQAKPGAPVTLAYDVWDDAGGLVRRDASFTARRRAADDGRVGGADATLTPEYPGITGQESLSDWDPPFPLDLSRITPRDEEYWAQVSRRAESDRHAGRRPAAVGIALRQADVDPPRTANARPPLLRAPATALRPQTASVTRRRISRAAASPAAPTRSA